MPEWNGVDAALLYLDKGVLPTHWDRDILFGQESQSQSDEMDSEDVSIDFGNLKNIQVLLPIELG